MTRLRLFFYLGFFAITTSLTPATEPMAQLLEAFLNSGGQASPIKMSASGFMTSLKELDFYTTGRLSLPFFSGFGVMFDLGGAGSGSPFLALPEPQRVYLDWNDNGSLSPAAAQARTMFMKIAQDRLVGFFNDDMLGSSDGEGAIDFFGEDDEAGKKRHPLERLFSFKVTPGLVYAIKLFLLLKHAGEHYGKKFLDKKESSDRFVRGFSYVADIGVLTLRLLKAWRRDSRAAGGISAAIEDCMPSLGQLLRDVSRKCIPATLNPSHDEMFLHNKLDRMWKLIMTGDGIEFGPDGSVQRGLGVAISGLECRSAEEAKILSDFLNQKQINWDKIETQDMADKPFIVRVAMISQLYAMQMHRLPEAEQTERRATFEVVRGIIEDIVLRHGQKEFGRYDLDSTNPVGVDAHLLTDSFRSLVGPGRPLGYAGDLPKVVHADHFVYYCTNETDATDAAKIVAVIFFQALWEYLEVMRGNNEMSAEITARVREKERRQQFAQAYLENPEASFLKLPLGLLLERPTVDFYAVAGPYFKDSKECSNAIKTLIKGTLESHKKAAARVGNLYREALDNLKKKGGKFAGCTIPSDLAEMVKAS